MYIRHRWFTALGLSCLAIAVGAPAKAQTYTMSYTFDTTAASFHINRPTTSVNNGLDVYAGPFRASFNGAPPQGYKNPFAVFCVDLDHYDTATTTVRVLPFGTTSPAGPAPLQTWAALQRASWLYQHYLTDVMGSNLVVTSWVNAAALQAAIWYVIEAKSNFTSLLANAIDIGHSNSIFYITADGRSGGSYASIVTKSNSYLQALRTASPNDKAPGTLFEVDPANRGIEGGQDMLGPAATVPEGSTELAPEGSSLMLLLMGGAPLAFVVMRRRAIRTAVL
jgi:hypothetical protein